MIFGTHNDKANNKKFLECTESYEKKEILKSLGFRWNPFAKAWQKEYTTLHELTTYLVDTMIACDCEYEVLEHSWARCHDEFGDFSKVFDRESYTPEALAKFYAKYGE